MQSVSKQPAARGLRAINYAVDSALSFVSAMVFMVLTLFIGRVIAWEIVEKSLDIPVLSYVASIVVFTMGRSMYYFVTEYFFGRTPAKFLTGTVVVSKEKTSTMKQLFIRTAARMLPFNEFSIFQNSATTWHDDLSNTMVVKGSYRKFANGRSLFMYAIGAIALILSAATLYFVVFAGVKQATGDWKIGALEVPSVLPRDVQAVDVIQREDDISYYEIRYEGSDVEFSYIERTAGFQFDPREDCVLNTSTNKDFGYEKIPDGLECIQLEEFRLEGESGSAVRVFKINKLPELAERVRDEVPEYYIAVAPQRYTIDITKGELSDQEVLDMARSLVDLYPDEIILD